MYELSTKPDFAQTIARFEAWWQGEIIDRLPINVYTLEKKRPSVSPSVRHNSLRERWMDVEYQVEMALARAEENFFLGDCYPVWFPNVGPDLTTTLFNAELTFGEDTSWVHPTVHHPGEWEPYLTMPLNFENPYWQTIQAMTRLAIERADHRLMVGQPDLHNSYDILVGLRSPAGLSTDLYDVPEIITQLAARGVEAMVSAAQRSFDWVKDTGMGYASWIPYYHEGPAYIPSCDFLALVSRRMGDQFIMPAIREEMRPLERSIFHLDGPTSLQHLPTLLAMPELNGIQWVYGAGQGDADDWIEVYQTCLRHGKCLQVLCETQKAALNVLRATGPKGVWLCVYEPFNTAQEAQNFIRTAVDIADETPSLYQTAFAESEPLS